MQAARFTGTRGVQDLLQAAEFLFWVHPRDSLGDLGPVTSPRHCCLSICEIKVAVSALQVLLERERLMRQVCKVYGTPGDEGQQEAQSYGTSPQPLSPAPTITSLAFKGWSKTLIIQEKATDSQGEL